MGNQSVRPVQSLPSCYNYTTNQRNEPIPYRKSTAYDDHICYANCDCARQYTMRGGESWDDQIPDDSERYMFEPENMQTIHPFEQLDDEYLERLATQTGGHMHEWDLEKYGPLDIQQVQHLIREQYGGLIMDSSSSSEDGQTSYVHYSDDDMINTEDVAYIKPQMSRLFDEEDAEIMRMGDARMNMARTHNYKYN